MSIEVSVFGIEVFSRLRRPSGANSFRSDVTWRDMIWLEELRLGMGDGGRSAGIAI